MDTWWRHSFIGCINASIFCQLFVALASFTDHHTLAEAQFRTSQVHRHLAPLELAALEALCLQSCMRCLSVVTTMTRHSSLLAAGGGPPITPAKSVPHDQPPSDAATLQIKNEHNNEDCLSRLSAMLCWKIA